MTIQTTHRHGATALGILLSGLILTALFYWLPVVSRGPVGVIVGGVPVVTPTATMEAR